MIGKPVNLLPVNWNVVIVVIYDFLDLRWRLISLNSLMAKHTELYRWD
tara:strand:+ start:516 stop:659 length:144 start_codon:yes stop_codon:yes gene_type:complete